MKILFILNFKDAEGLTKRDTFICSAVGSTQSTGLDLIRPFLRSVLQQVCGLFQSKFSSD
jgi:hypothetical protein